MSRQLFIFDLDGVLSDNTAANKLAGPEPDRIRERAAYDVWLEKVMTDFDKAPAVGPMLLLLRRLYMDSYTPAVVLTARNEEHRTKTEEWLKKQFVSQPMPRLIMRPRYNVQPSAQLKEAIILELKQQYEASDIVVIDDDCRGDLPQICKRNGWIFLKCFL